MGVGQPTGDQVRFGQVNLADAEVFAGVEPASSGHPGGFAQEVGGGVQAGTGCTGHGVSDPDHGRGVGEEPGSGGAVQVPLVQRDQAANRVQNVDGDRTVAASVTNRVGQHRGDAGLPGQAEHPGGVSGAGRGMTGPAVADDLYDDRSQRQQAVPLREDSLGEVVAMRQYRPAELGVRSEQDRQLARICGTPPGSHRVLGNVCRARHRGATFTTGMGSGDQPAQCGPSVVARIGCRAGSPVRQHGDPGQPAIGHRTPTDRGGARQAGRRCDRRVGPAGQPGDQPGRFDRQVYPEDRAEAGPGSGSHEFHRPVQPVPVGQSQGVHSRIGRLLDQVGRAGRPVAQGIPRGHVQVRELLHSTHRIASAHPIRQCSPDR